MAIISVRTGVFGDFSLTYDDVANTYQLDCESLEAGVESFVWSGLFTLALQQLIANAPEPGFARAFNAYFQSISRP